jgi:hypothetical protein
MAWAFFIISNDLTALPVAPIEGGVVRPSRRLEEDYAWLKELAGEGSLATKPRR